MRRIVALVFIIMIAGWICSCSKNELSIDKQCEISYQTAFNHFHEGRLQNGLLEVNKAIAGCPRIWKYWFLKASIEYGLENYLSSEDSAKQCVAITKECSSCYDLLGQIATIQKRWSDAREYFQKALDNPDYRTPVVSIFNMGVMYEQQGSYIEALEQFNKACSIDPSFDRAFHHKGEVLMKLNRADEAVFAYKQATVINKKLCDAWYGLVNAYLKSGQYKKAQDTTKDACRNLGETSKCCKRIQMLLR